MAEKEIKEMNLFEKMGCITAELGFVNKNLKVGYANNSYKAVSELDVIEAVKPLEAKYRVFSYPVNREEINNEILQSTSSNGTVRENLFLRVKTTYRFVNVDKPEEYLDIVSYGDGIDTGDKGCGKAMTYADKYALMKAYKISTGDDPDKEASKEYTRSASNLVTDSQVKFLQNIYKSAGEEWFTATLASYNLTMKSLKDRTMTNSQANQVIQDYQNYAKNKKSEFGN